MLANDEESGFSSSNSTMIGILADLEDLQQAIIDARDRLSIDGHPYFRESVSMLNTYREEIVHLCEVTRRQLEHRGEGNAITDEALRFFRNANPFEVDELRGGATLAALAAYSAQQQRRFESASDTYDADTVYILQVARMLTASIKTWSLAVESFSQQVRPAKAG